MTEEHSLGGEREERVNRILAEYLEAERAGQAPDRDELLQRHPDLVRRETDRAAEQLWIAAGA